MQQKLWLKAHAGRQRRPVGKRVARGVAALMAALVCGSAYADGDDVVVTVGSSKLTRRQVEQRLSALPGYQLATFGSNPDEVRRAFVDRVLVPELLYVEHALKTGVSERPAARDRVREILRQTMEAQIRDEVARQAPVTPADIKQYFEQNRARFETPRRIRVWRILVDDLDAAKEIAKQAHGTDGVQRWRALAREKSKDKATAMRDGDLGFIRADGTTDVPALRVDPALFAAVDRVEDGELVPEPVKEGESWAVLWRRGSLPAMSRTLEQEASAIRQVLLRKRHEQRRDALLADLEKAHVREVDESLLEYVKIDGYGSVAERRRPGIVPRKVQRAAPQVTPSGLR